MLETIQKIKGDAPEINDINDKIDQLNRLIVNYNFVTNLQEKAVLIVEIYQFQKLLDDAINVANIMTSFSRDLEELTNGFHNEFTPNLVNEFNYFGIAPVTDATVYSWDIENNRSDEKIISPDRFLEITSPGIWLSFAGYSTSTSLIKASRLLNEIDQSSIKENTKENFYHLIQLKQALRELIASEPLSKVEKAFLRGLILTLNGRINDILHKNESLRHEILPKRIDFVDEFSESTHQTLEEMVLYLSDNNAFEEDIFHQKFDDKFPSFKNYSVSYLGGVNTRNYLFFDPISQEKHVVKITQKTTNTDQASQRLRNTIVNDHLTPLQITHEGFEDPTRFAVVGLEVTEFCQHGDLLSYRAHLTNEEEILASAGDLYEQMAETLMQFMANNALFPDMKPTNFLVTDEGRLVIADTKSFINLPRDQEFSPMRLSFNQRYLYTEGFEPPELQDHPFISHSDSHQAFLMGFSLYIYLTGKEFGTIPQKYNPSFIDFNYPIFKTEKGQAFQALILDLIKMNPEERISLADAKQQLMFIQQGIKRDISSFKSKTEAYFFAINFLSQLQAQHVDSQELVEAINEIKIFVENHEQNPHKASQVLQDVLVKLDEQLTNDEKESLKVLSGAIRTSAYEQTLEEKYENPLARLFESTMQVELLQNPTPAMMEAVGEVSRGLLKVFQQLEQQDMEDILTSFAKALTSNVQTPTGFGSQPKEINPERIKEILQTNNPEDLNQIMFIHFLFAQRYMRILGDPIEFPNKREPVGKLKEIIASYNEEEFKSSPIKFFDSMDNQKLKLISDVKMYGSDLYNAESGRGRSGLLKEILSSQMGTLLSSQAHYEQDLPTDPSAWTPDAKYQEANLDSIYVRDLIENDAIYVAGPSGMTSLFLNIMEMYGNFPTIEEKQHYLAAVSAYMISGGLHSLHEVIGPAQYCLDLVPGYQVTPPTQEAIAAPPNFHQFYQQQMAIDPEFQKQYERGWEKVMHAYKAHQDLHVHKPLDEVKVGTAVHRVAVKEFSKKPNDEKSPEVAAKKLVQSIHQAISKYSRYIKDHPISSYGLGIFNPLGANEIKRVVDLLEQARDESTPEGVVQMLQNHLFRETKSIISKTHKPSNHSFISYLMNELKNSPQLVETLNTMSNSKKQLRLDPSKDYTQKNAARDRTSAYDFFISMDIPSTLSLSQ